MILQVPAFLSVTVSPLIVQIVVVRLDVVTGKPDDANGVSTTVGTSIDCGPGSGIVMVCGAFVIVNVRGTGLAALYAGFPACEAVIAQVPVVRIEMSKPATVQMDGEVEVRVTVRPELAVALTVRVVVSRVWFGGLAKLMVWVA